MNDIRKLIETIEQINEGRVEDFAIALDQRFVQELEQKIVRYGLNNEKGTEWAEGAEWVLNHIKRRHGVR